MKALHDAVIYSQGFCHQWNDRGWYMLLWGRGSRGPGFEFEVSRPASVLRCGPRQEKCLL